MKKVMAILLWPMILLVDIAIFLLGLEAFQEARKTTNNYYKSIWNKAK